MHSDTPRMNDTAAERTRAVRAIDRALAIQRPAVIAHVKRLRRHYPGATPEQLSRVLERHFLTSVTGSGAAVGAVAMVPGIGTGIALAVSTSEAVVYAEAATLFAQSMAELHGISVTDPDRARALVLGLALGPAMDQVLRTVMPTLNGERTDASVRQGPGVHWASYLLSGLPSAALGPLTDQLRSRVLPRLLATQGGGIVARAIPFGVGAAIGGTGNLVTGRRLVASAREAFGAPPTTVPLAIEPTPGEPRPPASRRRALPVPLPRLPRRRPVSESDDSTSPAD
ncbi:hypothetical protein [Mycetocola reblochoni]|nr:hypothetical protein [Mycetocola reblochoni]